MKYMIVGASSAAVNLATYFALNLLGDVNYLVSNGIAWVATLIFSYFTNKFFVFKTKGIGFFGTVKEFFFFTNSRIFSGIVDNGLMWFFVDILNFDSTMIKFVNSVVVVLINYVISCWIFKPEEKK